MTTWFLMSSQISLLFKILFKATIAFEILCLLQFRLLYNYEISHFHSFIFEDSQVCIFLIKSFANSLLVLYGVSNYQLCKIRRVLISMLLEVIEIPMQNFPNLHFPYFSVFQQLESLRSVKGHFNNSKALQKFKFLKS